MIIVASIEICFVLWFLSVWYIVYVKVMCEMCVYIMDIESQAMSGTLLNDEPNGGLNNLQTVYDKLVK